MGRIRKTACCALMLTAVLALRARAAAPEDAAAEEERWQLWLDVAADDELTGDRERAALSLYRFVSAADRRGGDLPANWVVVRDQARADIARLDGEILERKGRVTIASVPEGATATLLGGASANLPDKQPLTPFTAYFEPGSHSVRLFHKASDRAREVTFSVVAGATVRLNVDMRAGVPDDRGVVETPGDPVLGQRADGSDGRIVISDEGPDDDIGPAVRASGPSPAEVIGTASITAGAGALAAGVVFALVASGLDDEAACSGAACDVDSGLRRHVRRDASVNWDRATGTFIAGGALVAGGVIAILLGQDDDEPALRAWVDPEGAGVNGQFRF